MKLINILFLMLLSMGQNATAQVKLLEKKISVSCSHMSGKDFVEYLRTSQNINFSYSDNLISGVSSITMEVSEKPLGEVLSDAFEGADIEFREVGGQIVLKKSRSISSATTEPKPVPSGSAVKSAPENQEILQKYEEASVQMQSSQTEEELEDTYLDGKTSLYTEYLSLQEDSSKVEVTRNDLKAALRALRQDLIQLRDSIKSSKGVADLNESINRELSEFRNRNTDSSRAALADTSSSGGTLPVQVSFVPPLSTNGIMNSESVNMFSMNIIAGYSKGLEGFEFGSIANVEKEKVTGAQISGFANVVGKDVKGMQAAGFCNIAGDRVVGTQFSGFLNLAGDTSHAFQAAGFYNQVTGANAGGQFAGFMNVSTGSHFGPQGAGFMNVSGGDMLGFQAAGFSNIASGTAEGMQVAGFMNYARKMNGAQIGFLNIAGKLSGTQIGIFNFADSAKGAQIGFLSFTRKGYHKLELGTNELFFTTLSFKTGTRSFYNILSAGGRFVGGNGVVGIYGYGLGGEIPLSGKFFIGLEGACYQADDSRVAGHDMNLFANTRLLFGFSPAKGFSIVAGPTFNGNYVLAYPDDYAAYSLVPDNTVYTDVWASKYDVRDKYLALWPGFYGAVSLNF